MRATAAEPDKPHAVVIGQIIQSGDQRADQFVIVSVAGFWLVQNNPNQSRIPAFDQYSFLHERSSCCFIG